MKKSIIVFMVIGLLILSACRDQEPSALSTGGTSTTELLTQTTEQKPEETENTTMEDKELIQENIKTIMQKLSVEKKIAKDTAEILNSRNIQIIEKLIIEKESEFEYVIKLTDSREFVYSITLDKKEGLKTIQAVNALKEIIYNESIHKSYNIISKDWPYQEDRAWSIASILYSINIREIKKFIVEEQDESGCTIRLINSGDQVFYLLLDRWGGLSAVRKDTLQGEEIFRLVA